MTPGSGRAGCSWRWVVLAVLAQVEVVRLATNVHAYWAGDQYMWTIIVVTGLVLLLVAGGVIAFLVFGM